MKLHNNIEVNLDPLQYSYEIRWHFMYSSLEKYLALNGLIVELLLLAEYGEYIVTVATVIKNCIHFLAFGN